MFTLTVNQHARVDFALKPGAVTETVTTTAQAVSLDTDTAESSNLVSQQQVEGLPLNGRNFMQLLLVGAGAVTVGGEQGTMRQGEGNAISVNGGRPEGNNYTLDGLVNTDAALVTPAVILSQDAIQEFKVSSGTYSADQGFSATQINIVSKGGTNSLHGALFGLIVTTRLTPSHFLRPMTISPAGPRQTRCCARTSSDSSWAVRSTFRRCTTAATRVLHGQLRRMADHKWRAPSHTDAEPGDSDR